ncbi:TAF9, FAP7, transcription initiation factor TFIID subunit 9 / adenylate kinase [Babesia microti strain RI]|uniref:Adenylate kinase isoenzyme 6 homolog n=1 Tax=Babesia microti (strain RI) TaxID=1133968 RepID=A0A0K3ARC3_BABMR|nr:TAF9, FAP7, transcription initiation factor TFIID subunit 9 / adenylate kinase [Babesia microti strain RI]CTQ40995.1 TAF9, FAP7, transcription initiation factor TFIID subunit 9 / adenylate kinase [Babesia microti strain RI]|eukprot:XP_012649006.1 TAF9, FAP7, transcription initiation factor TFIID subunit 9 / adenylate kinase [Babesia microti strain RI]
MTDCGTYASNILVAGTPGVGKSSLCKRIAEKTTFKHLKLGEIIEAQKCYEEWDDDMDCSILDEDKTIETLRNLGITKGGYLLEFHDPSFLPQEWFRLVYVLNCDIKELGKRLDQRGYLEAKVRTNLQSEIFQVVSDNLINEGYHIHLLNNTTMEDMESNVSEVVNAIKSIEPN